jgi:hypothetical protein
MVFLALGCPPFSTGKPASFSITVAEAGREAKSAAAASTRAMWLPFRLCAHQIQTPARPVRSRRNVDGSGVAIKKVFVPEKLPPTVNPLVAVKKFWSGT